MIQFGSVNWFLELNLILSKIIQMNHPNELYFLCLIKQKKTYFHLNESFE